MFYERAKVSGVDADRERLAVKELSPGQFVDPVTDRADGRANGIGHPAQQIGAGKFPDSMRELDIARLQPRGDTAQADIRQAAHPDGAPPQDSRIHLRHGHITPP